MLHCLNSSTSENCEMSVLERQRSRLKQQQQQLSQNHPPIPYFNGNDHLAYSGFHVDQALSDLVLNGGAMKPDPGVEHHDFRRFMNSGSATTDFQMSSALPRTVSYTAAASVNSAPGKESCKKRKADRSPKIAAEEKKMKGCAEEESKITEQNSNSKSTTTTISTSANKNSKGASANGKKASDAPKADYIHVRARRGQATDSHSLAERVRREKISERMKYLQDLVPGCNKVTGKAGMLDEIINYVQSLQRQVEFLSMKLAAINPRLDFDIESYILKEMFPACPPAMEPDHSHLQFNTSVEEVSGSGLEMVVDPMDATLRRTISAPITAQQSFLNSSSLNQIQQVTWEDELRNLYSMEYQQGRSTFISQQITGFLEANHVKLEM
ncbi:hypothetical protein SASPL_128869 [Salvia splendens]|uniref:BHLH domain-containing protein n=2 Tax=Salvia splendens TaxID=180675 RepID=A0A8X8XC43_SALSN|nr:hypothetical protein SASPL_128869 [Salvia splendens]